MREMEPIKSFVPMYISKLTNATINFLKKYENKKIETETEHVEVLYFNEDNVDKMGVITTDINGSECDSVYTYKCNGKTYAQIQIVCK